MHAVCGANCSECELKKSNKCKGCRETDACPFGKKCWIAKYIEIGGKESFIALKKQIIDEINSLNIDGMPKIKELYPLNGTFVNLSYPLPNGKKETLLSDDEIYLGGQAQCIFNDDETKRCFGLIANLSFLLVSSYDENGRNPEIIIYKKR